MRPRGEMQLKLVCCLFLLSCLQRKISAQDPQHTKFDLAFAIPDSNEIGRVNFAIFKKFIKNVLRSFDIGYYQSHFGVLTYNDRATARIKFRDLRAQRGNYFAYDQLDRLSHTGGWQASLKVALTEANQVLFTREAGMRERYPKFYVVFVGGRESKAIDAYQDAIESLNQKRVKILLVYFGTEINLDKLKQGITVDEYLRIFLARNTAEMDKLVRPVSTNILTGNSDAHYELAFAILDSWQTGRRNFETFKIFVDDLLKSFRIGYMQSHFAILTYNSRAIVHIKFSDFLAQQGSYFAHKELEKITYKGGLGLDVKAVLTEANTVVFTRRGGSKSNYPKFLIVLVSGNLRIDFNTYRNVLKELEEKGVFVIFVYLGEKAGAEALTSFAEGNSKVKVYSGRSSRDIAGYVESVSNTIITTGKSSTVTRETTKCPKPRCINGPKGVQGFPGPAGKQGQRGITGKEGYVGLPGDKGLKGEHGVQGNEGPRGEKGLRGMPGYPGINGLPGFQGDPGAPGKRGECGGKAKRGDRGYDGADGFDGPPGEVGLQGRKGQKGESAFPVFGVNNGDPGESGDAGYSGPRGSFGDDGYEGTPGEPGDPGDAARVRRIKGSRGDQGDFGDEGKHYSRTREFIKPLVRGLKGFRGDQGDKGARGDFGNPGFFPGKKGEKGDAGENGKAGFFGPKGYQGPQGEDGDPGSVGEPGGIGFDGPDGPAGLPGIPGFPGGEGAEGPRGPPGSSPFFPSPGSKGKRGAPGISGLDGENGIPGDKGEKGKPGKPGPITIGDPGRTGKIGRPGRRGVRGVPGLPGMKGRQGQRGLPGATGLSGPDGEPGRSIPGEDGMTGPVGPRGRRGERGEPGPTGKRGPDFTKAQCTFLTCPKGYKGLAGALGSNGPSGPPGYSGYPGPKGFVGGVCPRCPKGPPGFQGKEGIPGRPGENGKTGLPGEPGQVGDTGFTGNPGPPGLPGDFGYSGNRGDIGYPGPEGDRGVPRDTVSSEAGEPGDIGRPGRRGAIGRAGQPGKKGVRGGRGPTGFKGDEGVPGIPGRNGIPGSVGSRGKKGEPGLSLIGIPGNTGKFGDPGERGRRGAIGFKGSKGESGTAIPPDFRFSNIGDYGNPGENGYKGRRGDNGPRGKVGRDGQKGAKGERGRSGFSFPGPKGFPGSQGTSGFGGPKGLKGIVGDAGPRGRPGIISPPGIKGSRGDRGAQGPDGNPGINGATEGCQKPREENDIAFVMDGSVSVGKSGFFQQKSFIKALLRSFTVSPLTTRVGILQYTASPKIEINFYDYNDQPSLFEAIDRISYQGGGQLLYRALRLANFRLFRLASFARRNAVKTLVIIADDLGREVNLVISEISKLRRVGVQVFVIGVGASINTDVFRDVIQSPKFIYQVTSFRALPEKANEFRSYLVPSCTSAGEPGEQGPKGPPGDPGRSGPRGVKGLKGMSIPGVIGPVGLPGEKGDPGDIVLGPPGSQGLVGFPGDIGRNGRKGRQGPPGKSGNPGPQGFPGRTVSGPKGFAGERGNPGLPGQPGPKLCRSMLTADLAFIVDTSSSVGRDQFYRAQEYIKRVVRAFRVGSLSRISVLTVADNVDIHFRFNDYRTNTEVENRIDRLRYTGGRKTQLHLALGKAANDIFRERPTFNRKQIILLITNGAQLVSADVLKILRAVEDLKEKKVRIVLVSIGRNVLTTQLLGVAYSPNDLIEAFTFAELPEKAKETVDLFYDQECKGLTGEIGRRGDPGQNGVPGSPGYRGAKGERNSDGPKGKKGERGDPGITPFFNGPKGDRGEQGPPGLVGCRKSADTVFDLVFLIDTSRTIARANLEKEREIVKAIIEGQNVGFFGTRVALVTYNTEVNVQFTFRTFYFKSRILRAVDEMPYEDGTLSRIDSGLDKVKREVFSETRRSAKKILILISHGNPAPVQDRWYLLRLKEDLKSQGVEIYTLAMGRNSDVSLLRNLATKDNYAFFAPDFRVPAEIIAQEALSTVFCDEPSPGLPGDRGPVGPPGTPGKQGQDGPQGRKGFRGDYGYPGAPGADGSNGRRGFEGDSGSNGELGETGDPGPPGPVGAPGDPGEPGFQGRKGPRGETGFSSPGPRGDDGDPGQPGFGRSGKKGEVGEPGREGRKGRPGDRPLYGFPGYKGFKGEQGEPGFPGENGKFIFNARAQNIKGEPGPTGYPGRRGAPGKKGEPAYIGDFTGFPGVPGERGDDGPEGEKGPRGDKGAPGFREGSKGSRGYRGSTGLQGPVGRPGTPGFDGLDGEKGERGETGPQGPRQIPLFVRSIKGFTGDPGFPGFQGDQGLPGEPGEVTIGRKGRRGFPGPYGIKGKEGDSGSIGRKGYRGRKGSPGFPGTVGSDGNPGEQGPRGLPGVPGEISSLPGLQGEEGDVGPRGPQGREGVKGDRGLPGFPGTKGGKGFPGQRGYTGFPGIPGDDGPQGEEGPKGFPGLMGRRGEPGRRGTPGYADIASGFVIVRHSQTNKVPNCPSGSTKLWDGYSMLYTVGNGKSHGQDLGDAGSCLKSFSSIPFLFCETSKNCKYASRNDFVYWLAAEKNVPMMPVEANAIEPFISRCAVCETKSVHVSVHSQDTRQPRCPYGWYSLWSGYSFLMASGSGGTGSGQRLESAGSCLESFRTNPFIECQGKRGTCHYFSDKLSFWLSTVDQGSQFEVQPSLSLSQDKGQDLTSKVSRCKVCIRKSLRNESLERPFYSAYEARNENDDQLFQSKFEELTSIWKS